MQTLEKVILVDDSDRQIGTGEKHEVHRQGSLHRAFSVIIWDDADRMLLQQRSSEKYHSGGLWTNACCGHPRPGEASDAAARRRLQQEMGFVCPLEGLGTIRYRAELDHDMIEHEIVHVFHGVHDGAIVPNPDEAQAYRWAAVDDVQADALVAPERYTAWFRKYLMAEWPVRRAVPETSG
ncbi:isopentenyl-diphosphate Delta-isomerase [Methyloceanibacter caenitepidi]|uniref:Isopentenyl-diphosphate Delta-isomerase n=1 Tax=Methyloceanibacter caenitepidi TaxID=1384459 RepID=A0A0A8K6G5_9HYPH|nr:isopentenyl-diphosphate Delta-isomerase [Methyloceanibacter caenitepidi]BAQ18538.1 isopentenyl-diphosphate delta-isomerase [Methyloceanibacter caenitepidi]